MVGDLTPTAGTVTRHQHLSLGRYYQHSVDLLDDNATVLDFFRNTYPNTLTFVRDEEQWRSFLGRYGCSGKMQTTKIGQLSDGQKSRLVIATICMTNPNMLLLVRGCDARAHAACSRLVRMSRRTVRGAAPASRCCLHCAYPHPLPDLDLEAIDGLARAINNYQGGLVLVSHDFRLIDAVAKEIWVCDKKTVTVWKGSIREYKAHLASKMAALH